MGFVSGVLGVSLGSTTLMLRYSVDTLIDPATRSLKCRRCRDMTSIPTRCLVQDSSLESVSRSRVGDSDSACTGMVTGRKCMIVANDPMVKGGTYYPLTVSGLEGQC